MTALGLEALKARLAALPDAAKAEVAEALGEIAADVIAEVRRALAASSRQTSAPGATPCDPAGDLAASLDAALDESIPRVTITAASPHAMFLEYGTRTMAPRPFLRPAVTATADVARAKLREALARAAQKAE